jgi:hypothetical protein
MTKGAATIRLLTIVLAAMSFSGAPEADLDLKSVDLTVRVHLARLEIHITISPAGAVRCIRTENKSWGAGDIDPGKEHHEIRAGQLTKAQKAELSKRFAGWEVLSNKPYGGVADGPEIRIQYGEQVVSGGSALPKQVLELNQTIAALAAKMDVVKN